MASRYTGLSAGERSSMAGLAATVAVLVVAMLLVARGVDPLPQRHAIALALFDIVPPPPLPPPPPPPVKQVQRTERPRIERAAPHARRPDAGSRAARLPSPAQLSIVPVEALQPSIVDVGPTLVDRGIAAALAAGGPGRGSGSGAGDGGAGGSGDQIPYFRAEWIRKPTKDEVDREWPRAVALPVQPITVLLFCDVRRNGHPFHCAVARETPLGRSLGELAIRLAEGALVKPVMHGAKVAIPRVIIPFTFQKHIAARSSAP